VSVTSISKSDARELRHRIKHYAASLQLPCACNTEPKLSCLHFHPSRNAIRETSPDDKRNKRCSKWWCDSTAEKWSQHHHSETVWRLRSKWDHESKSTEHWGKFPPVLLMLVTILCVAMKAHTDTNTNSFAFSLVLANLCKLNVLSSLHQYEKKKPLIISAGQLYEMLPHAVSHVNSARARLSLSLLP